MATVNLPSDVIFPLPKDDKDKELYRLLSEYFLQLKQTLIEIESKLP